MNPLVTLLLALLAAYALSSLGLAALVAVIWRAGGRAWSRPQTLLALRLLPAAGALFIALGVVLPAFVAFEPAHEREAVGLPVTALAALATALLASGFARGWRAWRATRRLLERTLPTGRRLSVDGRTVEILETSEPLVGVVGAFRPRFLAARRVLEACEPGEFRQVLAHESAHVAAADNLKLFASVASPDLLAWSPLGRALTMRWRLAAEYAADERATGGDRRRRLELASALLKVARLTPPQCCEGAPLQLSVAADDVAGRVRALLEPPSAATGPRVLPPALALALSLAIAAAPLYPSVHDAFEALISLGR